MATFQLQRVAARFTYSTTVAHIVLSSILPSAVMAKRKVAVDDDDHEALNALSQQSKRARTFDSDDEVVVDRSRHRDRKSGNGNGKARQEDSDDEEDEEDLTQEEHNEEEEQRFEELNGEAIRQRLEQKRNTFGVSRMSATSAYGSS